jgi:hypothetical protein
MTESGLSIKKKHSQYIILKKHQKKCYNIVLEAEREWRQLFSGFHSSCEKRGMNLVIFNVDVNQHYIVTSFGIFMETF